MKKDVLENPYILALLVGLHPVLFYLSNNWYMSTLFLNFIILFFVTLIAFFILSAFYLFLSLLGKKFLTHDRQRIIESILVFASILFWAYLLRGTLSAISGNQDGLLALGVLFLALVVAWFIPRIKISRLNAMFLMLCLISVLSGLISIATTDSKGVAGSFESQSSQPANRQVTFTRKPNVYFIVPDSYPNREALAKIYNLNNEKFYQQLESAGFSVYHSALANYTSTLNSLSSTFGMGHHYYRMSVGHNEVIGSRKYIASEQNPVVSNFKNNGYQVHYVHESEYLLTNGCFVDLCSPNVLLLGAVDFLIPYRFKSYLGLSIGPSSFDEKIATSIDNTSMLDQPRFTFAHSFSPGHSFSRNRTGIGLSEFRQGFFEKIHESNLMILKMVERIVQKDPNALIIISADHGGYGLGDHGITEKGVFPNEPVSHTILDRMGVLLAVRWPDTAPAKVASIKTNANLFRLVFAYLSEDDSILDTSVPDDGYLLTKPNTVYKVIRDGEITEPIIRTDVTK